MSKSHQDYIREVGDQDDGAGTNDNDVQTQGFSDDASQQHPHRRETDNVYFDDHHLDDNPFRSGAHYNSQMFTDEDNDNQSSDQADRVTCSKKTYQTLVQNNEILQNLIAKIQAGELVSASVDKNATKPAPKVTINNDTSQSQSKPADKTADSAPNEGPSVRKKSHPAVDNNSKTYAEACKTNTNSSVTSTVNPPNNTIPVYTMPNMQPINPNQYPFGGQQYPFVTPPYMSNPNMSQFNPHNTMPQYFINQSRMLNPPELPTFESKTLKHFKSYLNYFENYCMEHYGTIRERWNSILISKMSKEIKSTLPPEAKFEWDFDKVVAHIQDYIKLVGDKEEKNKVSKFLEMKKENNDSVTVFSVKLLQAFKAAYPLEEATYGHNTTLIERYLHELPDDIQCFVTKQTAAFKALGQSLPYESYVNLAENYEKEIKPRQQNLNKNNNAQTTNKFYQQPYKQQHTNYNKASNEVPLNLEVDNSQQQQLLHDIEAINLSIPPPNYQPNLNYGEHVAPMYIPINYNQGINTNNPGHLPPQQVNVQSETRPKDVPPVKNTPPGVCNYCEKKGHNREVCRFLAIRLREPYAVWCNKCGMKNHRDVHCTYQPEQSTSSNQ